jgi:hypothetical protein
VPGLGQGISAAPSKMPASGQKLTSVRIRGVAPLGRDAGVTGRNGLAKRI